MKYTLWKYQGTAFWKHCINLFLYWKGLIGALEKNCLLYKLKSDEGHTSTTTIISSPPHLKEEAGA